MGGLIQDLLTGFRTIRNSRECPRGLYLITDRTICNMTHEEIVMAALGAGVRWIQYREKNKSRREIFNEALRLRHMTEEFGARLIVNDHADIAVAVDADGVHLGQANLPLIEARKVMENKIIGISTHSMKEAIRAEKEGADYIGFGPVFHTETKDAGVPKGVDALREIKQSIKIPVVAIGGISAENLESVLETGVDAVAVASAILRGNIPKNAEYYINIIKGGLS